MPLGMSAESLSMLCVHGVKLKRVQIDESWSQEARCCLGLWGLKQCNVEAVVRFMGSRRGRMLLEEVGIKEIPISTEHGRNGRAL